MGINTRWSWPRNTSQTTSEWEKGDLYMKTKRIRCSLFHHPTLTPSNVFIDAMSMGLLNGAKLDFATELIGSSFRIAENPQAKGSGCGCGVSWEAKE
jgi:hypothetical protein